MANANLACQGQHVCLCIHMCANTCMYVHVENEGEYYVITVSVTTYAAVLLKFPKQEHNHIGSHLLLIIQYNASWHFGCGLPQI